MRLFPRPGTALMVLFLTLCTSAVHAQCTLTCLTGIVEVSIDNTCQRTVQPHEFLVPSVPPCDPFLLSLVVLDENGIPIPGNVLSAGDLYDTLQATVTFNGVPNQVCQVQIKPVDLIVCPPPQVFAAPANTCFVTESLPPLDISNSCNPIVLVQITTPFGNGQGPHQIPVGVHTVTYTAFTAANDSVKCTMTVTVANPSPPSVTCQDLSPGLPQNGTVQIPAQAFIASEADPCGIVLREVRRVSPGPTAYGPTATFNCDDIQDPVLVRIRVTNASGLTDSCEAMVVPYDKSPPLIVECPNDTIIPCELYTGNPNDYGMATFFDFCGPAPDTVMHEDLRDKCGVGDILRTFTAIDLAGNTATCTQVLTLTNTTPLADSLITWPEDLILEECVSPGAMHPDSLAPPYDRPVVDGSICSIVAIGWQDETLVVTNPGCFKILRTWTVVDCCLYDPQDPNPVGIFTHTQMIKVVDNEPPVLNCPPTFPVSVGPNCTVIFANLPDITADDCNPKVKITNNSPFSINKGPNASGNYPLGTTTVTFSASDGCANFSTCKVDVVVSDFAPPTPLCLHGLSTDLGLCEDTVVVKIMASFFNQNSFDNCSAKGELVFSFSADTTDNMITFSCEHQNDTIPVEMWVTDKAGNQAFCVTYIHVQDNFDLCPGNKTFTLGGQVMSAQGEPVPAVTVQLGGDASMQMVTGPDGQFSFPDLASGGQFHLSASKSTEPLAGVSTYDLLLIQKHLLGVKSLQDPHQWLAADANLSDNISIADIIQLRKWILNPQPDVSPYKAWRFLNPAQVMNPADPFQTAGLETITLGPLGENQTALELVALKVGDVSGDAFGTMWSGEVRQEPGTLTLTGEERYFRAGDIVEWTGSLGDVNGLQALQCALEWDPDVLEYEGLQTLPGSLHLEAGHFGISSVEQGRLGMSWSEADGVDLPGEEALFRMRFRARKDGRLSETMRLSEAGLQPEAWVADGPSEVKSALRLAWEAEEEGSETDFALYQNRPNPFRDLTMIGFRIPQAAEVILTLFTPGGQVITEFRGRYPTGYHEMSVPGELLPADGIIFYKLEAPGFSETKRMVRQ